jgi:hypothetical protein
MFYGLEYIYSGTDMNMFVEMRANRMCRCKYLIPEWQTFSDCVPNSFTYLFMCQVSLFSH